MKALSRLQAYSCAGQNDTLRCLLTNELYPYKLVCGAHIFKYQWRDDVFATLGFKNINDTRNGLLLIKPFEEAFDNSYMVILEANDVFTAHWLGGDKAKISDPKTYPWSVSEKEKMEENLLKSLRSEFGVTSTRPATTFKDYFGPDGKTMTFTTNARPFKRCLSYQARRAVHTAISEGRITDDWLDGKNLVFHSPQASKIENYFARIPSSGADPVEDPMSDDPDSS